MTQCTKHPKLVSSVELMYAALPLHENNYIRFFFLERRAIEVVDHQVLSCTITI